MPKVRRSIPASLPQPVERDPCAGLFCGSSKRLSMYWTNSKTDISGAFFLGSLNPSVVFCMNYHVGMLYAVMHENPGRKLNHIEQCMAYMQLKARVKEPGFGFLTIDSENQRRVLVFSRGMPPPSSNEFFRRMFKDDAVMRICSLTPRDGVRRVVRGDPFMIDNEFLK